MKLSVIVPVYNVELYLEDCIKSILNQSYVDFQLVLVNDGSTDTSLAICRKYEAFDPRLIVVDKDNEGVSIARNIGIKYATGDWICFVDSDDIISPNYLNNLLEFSENCDFVLSGINIQDQFNNNEKKVIPSEYGCFDLHIVNLLDKIPLLLLSSPIAKLYKREILLGNNIEFDERISIGEDYIFVTKYLSFISKCFFLQECDYIYFRRANSLSTSYNQSLDELISEKEIYMSTINLFSRFTYTNFEINRYYKKEFKKHAYRIFYSLYKNKKGNYSKSERINIIRNIDKDQFIRLKMMLRENGFGGYVFSLFFNVIVIRSFDKCIDKVIRYKLR